MARSKPLTVRPTSEHVRDLIASAVRTLEAEAGGITALAAAIHNGLGHAFTETIDLIRQARGRLIVTGMGKSGHVGRKIAATFASTGSPAFFVHPAEASHGDLGMVTHDDVIVGLSKSGEAKELADILAYAKRFKIPLIAITADPKSALGAGADLVLQLADAKEATAEISAPTTSTTLQMALGDALAVALLERRGFKPSDFHVFHPGGKLGAMLLTARALMHGTHELPLVTTERTMRET